MKQQDTINMLLALRTLEQAATARHNLYLVFLYRNLRPNGTIDPRALNKHLKEIGWTRQELYHTRYQLVRIGDLETVGRNNKRLTKQGLTKAKTIIKEYHQRAKNPPKPPKGLILHF